LKTSPSIVRITALRDHLVSFGVDGFVVPRGDEHQGEFVAPYAERLAWLTNFTGSAGLAVVLKASAAVFVDGRYTLQAREQVDGELYRRYHIAEKPPKDWLRDELKCGEKLGFDPHLHTPEDLELFAEVCEGVGATLVPLPENPIDTIWEDQPARPAKPLSIYPNDRAGWSSREKRKLVADKIKGQGLDAFFLSAPESICWLFNVRGCDVNYAPLALAYALVFSDAKASLFVDPAKISSEIKSHLDAEVSMLPYDGLGQALDDLDLGKRVVGADKTTASKWAVDRIEAANLTVRLLEDPCSKPKARKTQVEVEGVRAAHLRDGAALTRFLAWLSSEAPKGELTEVTAANQLSAFRAENDLYLGPSFPTISGAGKNGAIVHYQATKESAAFLKPKTIYLVDSGGQYLDGTTDVTRTVAIGEPTAEQKRRFTLVLKGHIALANVRFIPGTTGNQLDVLARKPLWQEGLDYDHGTGHGVGTYLGVHEGPQRIGKGYNATALEPGMVVSNEPGYYKAGEYGIRIENLVVVVECKADRNGERALLEFETLTLAPIDLALVDWEVLTKSELLWLNSYHGRVREMLTPLVDAETSAWLNIATATVS